ncbi:MAG: hypothetical protein J7J76_06610, partial [Candidatus Latescibacteria bacterium]|nr:hypothetical protein [Candidatus Latescibacterota bacterium]
PPEVVLYLWSRALALFYTGADFAGKMELPAILWTHFSDICSCGRALQSPIPSASGDASYNLFLKVEPSASSVKSPFFSRIWARDGTTFRGVFSESGFKNVVESLMSHASKGVAGIELVEGGPDLSETEH